MASTTRMKHGLVCRTLAKDPRRSCGKPHLLPWSEAIGPQPDPNELHPFFPPRKEKEIERESGGARGGGGEIRSEAEGVRGSRWGVDEPRKGNHRRITSVGVGLHVLAQLLETVL